MKPSSIDSILAQAGVEVLGLIVVQELSEKLKFALMVNSNIKFMEYEIDFHLKPHDVIHNYYQSNRHDILFKEQGTLRKFISSV